MPRKPAPKLELDPQKLNACVQCGLCKTTCPTYGVEYDEAYSPRGRILLAKALLEGKLELTQEVAKRWDQCTLCRNCENVCPNGVQYKELLVHARSEVQKKLGTDWVKYLLLKPLTLQGTKLYRWLIKTAAVISQIFLGKKGTMPVVFPGGAVKYFPKPSLNAQSLRGKVFLPLGEPKGTLIFFPGCTYENFYTKTAENVVRILQKLGYKVIVPDGVGCCGGPHLYGGFKEEFEKLKEKNEKVFKTLGEKFKVDGLVVVCPTGGGTFKEDYGLPFPVYELVEVLEREMPSLRSGKKERVSVHYPCHYYTAMGLNPSAFDKVITKDGDAELVKGELSKSCCGFAGAFSVKNPELSQKILRRKMEDYTRTKAKKVITSCPGCVIQLTEGAIRYAPHLEVQHLADFVAERLLTEEDRKKLKELFEEL